MTTFLIRSMSTTDYAPQYGQHTVTPYHLYLLKHRAGAYWSQFGEFETFATPQEAEAFALKLMGPGNYQIVPKDDRAMPTYWEMDDLNRPYWQTYKVQGWQDKREDRVISDERAKAACERAREFV